MKDTYKVLTAILKSVVGLALILFGILFAVFQNAYIAVPLGILGFLVCLFSYLDVWNDREKKKEKQNRESQNSPNTEDAE